METWREELYHSAKGTSWEKTNHKYIERKKVNGKWVYRYTLDSDVARNEPTAIAADHRRMNETSSDLREKRAAEAKSHYENLKGTKYENAYANEARHQGEMKTREEIQRANDYESAARDYKLSHPVDYYKNKGEAFIERLLKKN